MTVGAVIAIEDYDGNRIEMSDVTEDMRSEWAETLCDEIEPLPGISEVFVSGWSAHKQSAMLEIVVEYTAPRWQDWVEVTPNLRELSPRMRTVVDECPYVSSYDVTLTPESIGNGRHSHALYNIDVWFY